MTRDRPRRCAYAAVTRGSTDGRPIRYTATLLAKAVGKAKREAAERGKPPLRPLRRAGQGR